jgi:hypothetical protein
MWKTLAVLLAIAVFVFLLATCKSYSKSSETSWWSAIATGEVLYAVRHDLVMERHGIPIPERPPEHFVSSDYTLVEIDLTGRQAVRFPQKPFHVTKHDEHSDSHDFLALDASGRPRLWGRRELAAVLRGAAGADCEGDAQSDHQDSRVLYYYCAKEDLAYRLEPPYVAARKIQLGEAGGMRLGYQGYKLSSPVGDPKLYVWASDDFLFELTLDGSVPPVELKRFAAPEETLLVDPANPPGFTPGQPVERLIGISSKIRIHEVSRADGKLVVSVARRGDAPQLLEYPYPANLDPGRFRYFANSQKVVWIFSTSSAIGRMLALDLTTGSFAWANMPAAN